MNHEGTRMAKRLHMLAMRALALAASATLAALTLLAPLATPSFARTSQLVSAQTTTVTASGREVADYWGPELVIDGDKGESQEWRNEASNQRNPESSRWSAGNAYNNDDTWIALDLGATAAIDDVTVTWSKQYATDYTVELSDDGATWTAAAEHQKGEAAAEVTTRLSGATARHIRIHVVSKNADYATGIWEIEATGAWTADAPGESASGKGSLPSVIPQPASYTAAGGKPFVLQPASAVVAKDAAAGEAEKLAETLRASTGYELPVVGSSDDGVPDIELAIAGNDGGEGYAITAAESGLVLTASTTHGLFNGAQTIYQLFGPFSTASFTSNGPWDVPALAIEDAPRFGYRGVMLDPARSFLSVDEVKQAIDVLALYKISYLHLHLTDDQGWRIQITNEGRAEGDTIDYERLTEISGGTAIGTTQWQSQPGRSGFYTQDDLRDIVAYAGEHHIEVVPEVDMPGHSQAILHAIPQLNTAGSSHDGTIDPATGATVSDPANYITAEPQGSSAVGNSYLDPDSEATWTFLGHVVDQVSAITGSTYFHIGGDETHAMDAQHPGKAGEALTKAEQLIRERGITPIGWNEWAQGGGELNAGDTLQYWSTNPAGIADAVRDSGAKVIYSNASNAYFPQRPGTDVAGPSWASGKGYVGIDDFYNYDPSAALGLADDDIRGVEGAMWSEHVRGIQDFFYPAFPRALALAEVGWTPQVQRAGKVADLRRRIAEVEPAPTVAGADFYSGDGVGTTAVVAASDLTLDEGAQGAVTIARAFLPATAAQDVRATITWSDGTTQELTVSQGRVWVAPSSSSVNGRAQGGLWELALDTPPAKGTHEGTVTFADKSGHTATDTVRVTVGAAEVVGPTTPEAPEPPVTTTSPSTEPETEAPQAETQAAVRQTSGPSDRSGLPQTNDPTSFAIPIALAGTGTAAIALAICLRLKH